MERNKEDMEEKKFELTDEYVVNEYGVKLFQIRCLRTFGHVQKGDLGGYVEKEDNLSHSGDAWVSGNARIDSDNSHCGFDCFGSSNRHTHAYRTKDGGIEVTCGCFRGSLEEFEKKVEKTHAGDVYEKQYKAIINVIKIKFGVE